MKKQKYTIKEFFEDGRLLGIHIPIKEDSIKLCNAFDDAGYRWYSGGSYRKNIAWEQYKENTVYSNSFTLAKEKDWRCWDYEVLTIDDIIFEDDEASTKHMLHENNEV